MYTDGSCWPTRNGPGGHAAILVLGDGDEIEVVGGAASTTNNRMELQALISAMQSIEKPASLEVYSDSQYVVKGAGSWLRGKPKDAAGWMVNWNRSRWRNGLKERTNSDLWKALYSECLRHNEVDLNWVRGHAGNLLNERCDQLCLEQRLLHTSASDCTQGV